MLALPGTRFAGCLDGSNLRETALRKIVDSVEKGTIPFHACSQETLLPTKTTPRKAIFRKTRFAVKEHRVRNRQRGLGQDNPVL
jgi:hypothetical protein